MPDVQWYTGDVFDGLAQLETGSVDLVVTSPPFLALRSYLPDDHPDKSREIGTEPNPGAYVSTLLAVCRDLRRVLAPHGSIAVELGDTYSGSSMSGGDDRGSSRYPAGRSQRPYGVATGSDANYRGALDTRTHGAGGDGWPEAKSRSLIPELFRIGLAYGVHPLTGSPSPAGRWILRNVVTWTRRNPPVGELGDKWRPATSDIVIAATSPRRFWNDRATRRPSSRDDATPDGWVGPRETARAAVGLSSGNGWTGVNPYGTPLNDWWEISPRGYDGAHYAVMASAVVVPLVAAMVPPRVCLTCGDPSRLLDGDLGWTDCGHDSWRAGVVLDPFAGSGTTLVVAHGHGADAIGIDLDHRNRELTQRRLGPIFDLAPLERAT